jgi:DUF438 domain-containing protein
MNDSMDRVKRQEILKDLIQELHAGKSVDDVKGAFARLIQDVDPSEIAEMEQSLIAEGLPETEVKRLCDVHVAVFRESLDAQAQARPETIPGHPVHTFLAENAAAEKVLAALQEAMDVLQATPGTAQLAKTRQELARLREYETHYVRKENVLFPYLERHNFSGPSTVMWAIHDDVRAGWKALDQLLVAGPNDDWATFNASLDEIFVPLKTAISEMFYKEENILFPTALKKLSQEEWVEIRAQESGVGYCYVEPGHSWLPAAPVGDLPTILPTDTPLETAALELHLDTGVVTPEQINLLLTHLPVEITFVDKDDRVRYYSQTKDLIFPRSPAIIGRQVQNCHPPASVHRVQRILDDFRAGRRDSAEFWIHMKGMFVYIRYFAIRDEAGEYQGTMEVTQEISRIRQLQGERRLQDEKE